MMVTMLMLNNLLANLNELDLPNKRELMVTMLILNNQMTNLNKLDLPVFFFF